VEARTLPDGGAQLTLALPGASRGQAGSSEVIDSAEDKSA
jgi:hypothetical protein